MLPERVGEVVQHRPAVLLAADVDLREHARDFLLPPLPDVAEQLDLGLRQRAVDRRHEEDDVGPRQEALGDLLVPAQRRVRPGGVDDVHAPQPFDRNLATRDVRFLGGLALLVSVPEHVHAVRHRQRPLGAHVRPQEGVDERRFPRLHLADDDEQEHVLEVGDEVAHTLDVGPVGLEGLREREHAFEQRPLPGDGLGGLLGQDLAQHAPEV